MKQTSCKQPEKCGEGGWREDLCQRHSEAPGSVEVRVTGKTVNFNKVNCWSPDMLKALQERHGGGAKHGVCPFEFEQRKQPF